MLYNKIKRKQKNQTVLEETERFLEETKKTEGFLEKPKETERFLEKPKKPDNDNEDDNEDDKKKKESKKESPKKRERFTPLHAIFTQQKQDFSKYMP